MASPSKPAKEVLPVHTGSQLRKALLITEDFEQSPLDNRSYRIIRLENGMEVLLAHDPDADVAGASMDVGVGSFSDEDDMPGLAHAVEHALFLGTRKYPEKNDLHRYCAANSGQANAYTLNTSTNYYFEVSAETYNGEAPSAVNPSALRGALDRFSQLFREPLFSESAIDNELTVVDSEFKRNLQNDRRRLLQLEQCLSNPHHPYHRFTPGSLEVLKTLPVSRGIDVREKLVGFFNKHYSANRMKLSILGKEPLDVLEEWVVEFFGSVPDLNLSRYRWETEVPLRRIELGMQCFAKPATDLRELHLYFPYFDEEEMYESLPSWFVSHLIGHEGPGSILACLKSMWLADQLIVGPEAICPGTPGIFKCQFTLTEEGIRQYKKVVKVFFQYIEILRQTVPEKWRFDEQRYLSQVAFKFREKVRAGPFTRQTSSLMQGPIVRRWLLSGLYPRKFSPSLIEKMIGCLRLDNCRIIMLSQEFPGHWDQVEPWYGTEFGLESIPDGFGEEPQAEAASTAPPSTLHLPRPNLFIPKNFDVERKEIKESAVAPLLVCNDDFVRAWWKKDDTFWVPRANLRVRCKSPVISESIGNILKARLFIELVKDALETSLYDAELAGLYYTVGLDQRGLFFSTGGYNDMLQTVLEQLLPTLRNLEVKDDRFKIVKARLMRGYNNKPLQSPDLQADEYLYWLNTKGGYIAEEFAKELPSVTSETMASYLPRLWERMHVELLVHGNIEKKEALRWTEMVRSELRFGVLPEAQWPASLSLVLPPGSNYVFRKTLGNPKNVNHCIEYLLYTGDLGDPDVRARTRLLCQIMSEPAFSQLRTKEKLGYIMSCRVKYFDTTSGIALLLQSERSPQYLESRVDAFITEFGELLEDMTDADLEQHKRSVVAVLLKRSKTLDEESAWYWNEISGGYYDFTAYQHSAKRVMELTKADIVAFYKQCIDTSSPTRAKLIVQLFAQGSTAMETEVEPASGAVMLITDVTAYKASLEASAAKPVMDITHYEDAGKI